MSSLKVKYKKVASVWNNKENTTERYGKGFHWVESPRVMQRINKKISGDPNIGWIDYFCDKYLQKSAGSLIGLSLGCGAGALERQVQSKNLFKQLDANDIADEAIKECQKQAQQEHLNINYEVANLNKLRLKKHAYDVIFANSILHHLENLEHVMTQMNEALVDDGLVVMSEYVGPSQFQYTPRQVAIINDVLELLPLVYRTRVTDRNNQKPAFVPPTKKFMDEFDPSEAIRSAEVVKQLKKTFIVVEHTDFGGTLLHMLLQDIVGNFNEEDFKDMAVMDLLIYLEDILIRADVLTSDFTFMVLRKKKIKKVNMKNKI